MGKTCGKSGLEKFGQRDSALAAIKSKTYPHLWREYRCLECNCIHIHEVAAIQNSIPRKTPPLVGGASGRVYVQVKVILEATDKAFYVVLKNNTRIWLPLSQIDDAEDYKVGDQNIELSIPEWLANEKEIKTP